MKQEFTVYAALRIEYYLSSLSPETHTHTHTHTHAHTRTHTHACFINSIYNPVNSGSLSWAVLEMETADISHKHAFSLLPLLISMFFAKQNKSGT